MAVKTTVQKRKQTNGRNKSKALRIIHNSQKMHIVLGLAHIMRYQSFLV